MERISEEKFFNELKIPVQVYTEPKDFVEYFAPKEKPKETQADYIGRDLEEVSQREPSNLEEKQNENSSAPVKTEEEVQKSDNKYRTASKMIVAAIDIAIPALVELIAEKQTENATPEEKEELKEQWFEYFRSIEKTPAPWVFLVITNLSVYGLDLITIGKGVYDRVKNNGQIPRIESEFKAKPKTETETKAKPQNPFRVKNNGSEIEINNITDATIEEEVQNEAKKDIKTEKETLSKNGLDLSKEKTDQKQEKKCAECFRPLLVGQKTYCSKKCSATANNRKRRENAKTE
jgi:hypothetical protein